MATEIKSKNELASLASELSTLASDLKTDGENLKLRLSSLENYDGIDVVGPGKILSGNIDNTLADLNTVSTNIKNYASSVIGFDIDDFNDSGSSSSKMSYEDLFATDGSAEGNARVIWNFFKYKGLSDAATAGILGNIQAESGFNPAIVERATGIGYGLIQWSFGRRTSLEQAASQKGVDPSNLQFQLEYLWDESVDPNSSYGKRLAAAGFYNTNSPSDAAYYFHNIVEGSADTYEMIQNNRCRTAEQWYNQFKGTSAGSVGPAISTSQAKSWASLAGAATATTLSYTPSSGGYSSYSTSYSPSSGGGYSGGGSAVSSFPRSTADRNVKISNVDFEKLEKYLDEFKGTSVKLPEGLGSKHTYMGWQCITARSSDQYKLIESAGMNFDEQGFGKIGDRYVVATTTTFGNVGDFIDVVQEDGTVIKCIIGDIKSQGDANCNKWGHSNGVDVVEFVVDKSSWYGSSNSVVKFHPEWNKNIDTIINKGNYFDLAQKYPKTAIV